MKDNIWVAVRVERGFVADVCAFTDEKIARRRESLWRQKSNPDYDESDVLQVRVDAWPRRKTRKAPTK